MQSGKLSSSLQPGVASAYKESKHSVRLSKEASVSKKGLSNEHTGCHLKEQGTVGEEEHSWSVWH